MIKLALVALAASAASVKREISGVGSFSPAVTSTLAEDVLSPIAVPGGVGNLYSRYDDFYVDIDDDYYYYICRGCGAWGHAPDVSGESEEVDGDVAEGLYYDGPSVLNGNLGRLVRIPGHLDPEHDPLAPTAFFGRLLGHYY